MNAGFVSSFLPTSVSVRQHQRLPFCGRTPSAPTTTAARFTRRNHRVISCSSQPDREVADENDALQRELRAKVKELFGGAENVSIAVNGERARFTVRRNSDINNNREEDPEYRQAVFTASSIAVLSVVAALVFAFMYNTGAIHGSPDPQKGAYPYHSSNSRSRVDPYAMLGRDLDFGNF